MFGQRLRDVWAGRRLAALGVVWVTLGGSLLRVLPPVVTVVIEAVV